MFNRITKYPEFLNNMVTRYSKQQDAYYSYSNFCIEFAERKETGPSGRGDVRHGGDANDNTLTHNFFCFRSHSCKELECSLSNVSSILGGLNYLGMVMSENSDMSILCLKITVDFDENINGTGILSFLDSLVW